MRVIQSIVAAVLALLLMVSVGSAHARFLSVDPVAPSANSGQNFNRYHYANNNPYRFTDPDGRQSRELNFETARSGYQPPPRSADDWLGPAIGAALTGVVAAPVMGYTAGAIMARPAASSLFNAAVDAGMGDALGGASLAAGGATLFRVVDSVELRSIQEVGRFLPSPTGFEVKQFVGSLGDAKMLGEKFSEAFKREHSIVEAFAPQHVLDASHVGPISDLGRPLNVTSVPNALLPSVQCQGVVDAC